MKARQFRVKRPGQKGHLGIVAPRLVLIVRQAAENSEVLPVLLQFVEVRRGFVSGPGGLGEKERRTAAPAAC